jgi:alginate O-acetyltransferase complex protein AlgI
VRRAKDSDGRCDKDVVMLFSSMSFIEFFLAVWGVHWLLRSPRQRHYWLLIASLVFYGSWSVKFLGLLAATGFVNYFLVLALDQARTDSRRHRLLVATLAFNLGQLALFKYADFFSANLAGLMSAIGFSASPILLKLVLPLGISFYVFEFIAYAVDVYRRKSSAQRDPLHFAMYTMFFPRLVAGPIVRPGEFFPQLSRPRKFSWLRTQVGFQFFLWGFFKKVVVADPIGLAIDPFFADPSGFSSLAAWLAILGYSIQIYCDFSGYSDMAVGLGHMLGYRLPENFRLPYLAADIREFWQRWHLSLSRWIRDYLYISMGGNRVSDSRQLLNLVVVMTICGLWHGAQWTFIVWGFLHGVLLVLHRVVPWPNWLATRTGNLVCIGFTFLTVTLGWVLFRASSLSTAGAVFHRLFVPLEGALYSEPMLATLFLGLLAAVVMHLGALELRWRRIEARISPLLVGSGWALFLFFIHALTPAGASTFIYFQF